MTFGRKFFSCCEVVTILIILLVHSSAVHAGEIWDGGGSDDNWTTGANWDATLSIPPQIPPPNNGTADIHFVGNQGTFPNVDVPYSINSRSLLPQGGGGSPPLRLSKVAHHTVHAESHAPYGLIAFRHRRT